MDIILNFFNKRRPRNEGGNVKKSVIITILTLLVMINIGYGADLPKPKGGIKEKDLLITNWNPPTSLSTHFGDGTNSVNDPIFYFNLNLGYLRYYMKSDVNEDDTYLFNPSFSYIAEFKPLDFASFLTSGSGYAIFMEKNEWLRNTTFIASNKTYSSTQFITGNMLWYFDFLYNGINVPNVIIPQSQTSKSALENLYPTTRELSYGFANRFHLYKSSRMSFGLVGYFEFIPTEGTQRVAKGPNIGTLKHLYSSAFTYSALGGLFYRYKKNDFQFHLSGLYQRMEGDYDAWVITLTQNTFSGNFETSYFERYFLHLNYFLINWISTENEETFNSNTYNIGLEIKGFGGQFEWMGIGLDLFYQTMVQERGYWYDGDINSSILVPSINWYPMAFHKKNHQLKISLLYGYFDYNWSKGLFSKGISEKDSGSNESIMVRADYAF